MIPVRPRPWRWRPRREKTGQTLAWAIDEFIEKYRARRHAWSRGGNMSGILNRVVEPAWHGRTIHSIRRRDVIDLVEGIREQHPTQANRVLAVVGKMFAWLEARDEIAISPTRGVKLRAREKGEIVSWATASCNGCWPWTSIRSPARSCGC